jgi:hypothetical protein
MPGLKKAFTSVAVLLMSVAMGLDSFNRRKAIVVLAISFGVALALSFSLRHRAEIVPTSE